MNNFLATSIDEPHLAEFKASAIAEDIIELNFRSWNPTNENDLFVLSLKLQALQIPICCVQSQAIEKYLSMVFKTTRSIE